MGSRSISPEAGVETAKEEIEAAEATTSITSSRNTSKKKLRLALYLHRLLFRVNMFRSNRVRRSIR